MFPATSDSPDLPLPHGLPAAHIWLYLGRSSPPAAHSKRKRNET